MSACKDVIIAVLLACGIVALPRTSHADVALYSELMHSVDGSDATLSAYGVAEGDELCSDVIDVDVYLFKQPDNVLLASNGNSDWCYASATASLTQDASAWEQSEYEARATSPGHYCASNTGRFGIAIMTYRLDYIETADSAHYIRCNSSSGPCNGFYVSKEKLGNPPTWPLYAYLSTLIWRPFYYGLYVCHIINGSGISGTSCVADPLPPTY